MENNNNNLIDTVACETCKEEFGFFLRRRHHCRACNRCICSNCSRFVYDVQTSTADVRNCILCAAPSSHVYFANSRGIYIYRNEWLVNGNTEANASTSSSGNGSNGNDKVEQIQQKALVFLAHGLAEHCNRYAHVAEALNKNGYSLFAIDHQGHGNSAGDRVHVEHFNHFVDDNLQHIDIITDRFPGVPFFLLGHSMGGLITFHTAHRLKLLSQSQSVTEEKKKKYSADLFRGVILSAPALMPDPNVAKPHLVFIVQHISSWLPKLELDSLDSSSVSRDKEVVAKYDSDNLISRGGVKAKIGYELLNAMAEAEKLMPILDYNFIILQGTADKLVNPEGAKKMFELAKSSDKELKTYQNLYHEIFNEPEKEIVIKDMIDWMDKRLPVTQPIVVSNTNNNNNSD